MRLVEPFLAKMTSIQNGSGELAAHLVFMGSDPLVVRLVVEPASPDAVTWLLSRELLVQAEKATPGALVGIPGADTTFIRNEDSLSLTLYSGTQASTQLTLPMRNVRRLLAEVADKYHLESVTVNAAVDAFLASLPSSGR